MRTLARAQPRRRGCGWARVGGGVGGGRGGGGGGATLGGCASGPCTVLSWHRAALRWQLSRDDLADVGGGDAEVAGPGTLADNRNLDQRNIVLVRVPSYSTRHG